MRSPDSIRPRSDQNCEAQAFSLPAASPGNVPRPASRSAPCCRMGSGRGTPRNRSDLQLELVTINVRDAAVNLGDGLEKAYKKWSYVKPPPEAQPGWPARRRVGVEGFWCDQPDGGSAESCLMALASGRVRSGRCRRSGRGQRGSTRAPRCFVGRAMFGHGVVGERSFTSEGSARTASPITARLRRIAS